MPGAAAVLLGLKPGLGASSGPVPGAFSVCLALLLHHRDFIIRVLQGKISRQSPKALGSAVLLGICTDGNRRWQAHRGSAWLVFLWLGLRTFSFGSDLSPCYLEAFGRMRSTGICGASPHPPTPTNTNNKTHYRPLFLACFVPINQPDARPATKKNGRFNTNT